MKQLKKTTIIFSLLFLLLGLSIGMYAGINYNKKVQISKNEFDQKALFKLGFSSGLRLTSLEYEMYLSGFYTELRDSNRIKELQESQCKMIVEGYNSSQSYEVVLSHVDDYDNFSEKIKNALMIHRDSTFWEKNEIFQNSK